MPIRQGAETVQRIANQRIGCRFCGGFAGACTGWALAVWAAPYPVPAAQKKGVSHLQLRFRYAIIRSQQGDGSSAYRGWPVRRACFRSSEPLGAFAQCRALLLKFPLLYDTASFINHIHPSPKQVTAPVRPLAGCAQRPVPYTVRHPACWRCREDCRGSGGCSV